MEALRNGYPRTFIHKDVQEVLDGRLSMYNEGGQC